MNIEEIIQAWKAEKREDPGQRLPENPVGNELSDEELEEVIGGQQAAASQYHSQCCITATVMTHCCVR